MLNIRFVEAKIFFIKLIIQLGLQQLNEYEIFYFCSKSANIVRIKCWELLF